jgi:hypothetical protein
MWPMPTIYSGSGARETIQEFGLFSTDFLTFHHCFTLFHAVHSVLPALKSAVACPPAKFHIIINSGIYGALGST